GSAAKRNPHRLAANVRRKREITDGRISIQIANASRLGKKQRTQFCHGAERPRLSPRRRFFTCSASDVGGRQAVPVQRYTAGWLFSKGNVFANGSTGPLLLSTTLFGWYTE